MKKITISYHIDDIRDDNIENRELIDAEIEKAMKKIGYTWTGHGYNLCTMERDITFIPVSKKQVTWN